MESRTCIIGDLKNGINSRWNYPRLQININEADLSFFPELHSIFKIHLIFSEGKIIDKKGREYCDGIFLTRVVKDHPNRFGKGTVGAICAIWADNKRDGILPGWLKNHELCAGDKVKIGLIDSKYFLESI
ncbi:MAG: hypothetical protein WAX07_05820 [Candidatus Altiarchaeia archaeon]